MCHMYDRICFRWPCEIPAMPSYLPHQMHRRLVNAELYLSILHGASGRGTFDYVRKPILNKEWVAIVRAHMSDVRSQLARVRLEKGLPCQICVSCWTIIQNNDVKNHLRIKWKCKYLNLSILSFFLPMKKTKGCKGNSILKLFKMKKMFGKWNGNN